MGYLIDIVSAFIWVVCAVAPGLLGFYAVAGVVYAFRAGKTCAFPRLWQAVSGIAASTEEDRPLPPHWRGLCYGLDTLPGACLPKLLIGLLIATGIMLTVPWDYTFYDERPAVEAMELLMLLILALVLRMPLCASLPGAIALLAKSFSPGLALLYLLLSPAALLAFGERGDGVSRAAYIRKALPMLLLLAVPLVLLCLLLWWIFPNVKYAGLQGPPVLGISVTSQICGSVFCAIMLRLAILRLINRWESQFSK